MSKRVDLDRLADYVGGALDGTPEAAEVRGLVDTDPEWAAAHEDLAAAMSSVTADLRTVGEVVDAVPEDVVARLDAVLRNLGSSDEAENVRRAADRPPRGPGATGPGATGPGRDRRRRAARWAAGLSAAAAVFAFGVGIVSTFETDSSDSGGSSSAEAPAMNQAAPPAVGSGAPTVISGRDYRAGSFDNLDALVPGAAAPFATSERSAADTGAKANQLEGTLPPGSEPPELTKFRTVPAVLRDCLDAVQTAFGGQVRVVDLARFEGKPAVVVVLDGSRTGAGRPLVVAAGQNCGQPAGTTDELFHGPLT
jgi:hypothetical protein